MKNGIAQEHAVTCPDCGAQMKLRETVKYRYGNGAPRLFYGCSRWPECKGTHGAHPDGSPLGTPADSETKKARVTAHQFFDSLWKPTLKTMTRHAMTRDEAYLWMQSKMGLRSDEAHIGRFTTAQCEQLANFVNEYWRSRML